MSDEEPRGGAPLTSGVIEPPGSGREHAPIAAVGRRKKLERKLARRKKSAFTFFVYVQTIQLPCYLLPIHNMHIKRWRRLRDGGPAPWQADTNAYKQRFWCHDRPRSEKNGGFGYARGIFHEETMSVYR